MKKIQTTDIILRFLYIIVIIFFMFRTPIISVTFTENQNNENVSLEKKYNFFGFQIDSNSTTIIIKNIDKRFEYNLPYIAIICSVLILMGIFFLLGTIRWCKNSKTSDILIFFLFTFFLIGLGFFLIFNTFDYRINSLNEQYENGNVSYIWDPTQIYVYFIILLLILTHNFYINLKLIKYPLITYDEEYWKEFVEKNRNYTEARLWDLKETFDVFNVSSKSDKKKGAIKLCKAITGFANADGGLLIVGVRNNGQYIGFSDLESKQIEIKRILKDYVEFEDEFIIMREIKIHDSGKSYSILLIFIIQTNEVLGIRVDKNTYKYAQRQESSTHYVAYKEIKDSKRFVSTSNFFFISKLEREMKKSRLKILLHKFRNKSK